MNEIIKPLKVAIYCRVSGIDQMRNWTSLESQDFLLRKYIESKADNWWQLDESLVFSDWWVSWAKDSRPWLDKLREAVIEWRVDKLLIYKIDRLYRETQLLLSFVTFLEENWVELVSKEDNIDTKSSQWRFFLTLLGAFAAMERDLIKERTVTWKLTKAGQWYYVWGSMPPTWYIIDENQKMKVDEDEAEIIRKIFNLSAEWKSNEEISKLISSLWIKTKFEKYKKDTNKRVKKVENYWSPRTIWKILKNETYIWYYYYWKTTKEFIKETKKTIIKINPESEWIRIPCPSIISEDIFNRAQETIEKNKSHWKWQKRIFTWKVICGLCWNTYNWYKSTKNTMNYRCYNTYLSKAMSEENLCHNSQVSEKILRTWVIKRIYELIRDPSKFYENYINNNEEFNKVYKRYEWESKELSLRIGEIETKNKILINELSKFDSESVKWSIREQINDNEWKVNEIRSRLQEVQKKLLDMEKQKSSKKAINEFIKSYKLKLDSLSEEQEDELINIFVDKIIIDYNEITVELNITWNINDKNWYEELRKKLEKMDEDNKKKLKNSEGGEKMSKSWTNENWHHKNIKKKHFCKKKCFFMEKFDKFIFIIMLRINYFFCFSYV